MKKIITMALVLVLALVLSACKAGTPYSTIKVDPKTGAGEKTLTVRIYKNGAEGVGNNFGEGNYIPDPNKLLELFKNSVPEGFKVEMKDEVKMVGEGDAAKDAGYYELTTSFSFTSIEDYNEKLLSLVGKEFWDTINADNKKAAQDAGQEYKDIQLPSLTSTTKDGKQTFTFTEDMRVTEIFGYWAAKVCFDDKTGAWVNVGQWLEDTPGNWVYHPEKPSITDYKTLVSFDDTEYTVEFGEDKEVFNWSESNEVSMSAAFDAPVATPQPTEEPEQTAAPQPTVQPENPGNNNPATGDVGSLGMLALTAMASGTMLVALKRKK